MGKTTLGQGTIIGALVCWLGVASVIVCVLYIASAAQKADDAKRAQIAYECNQLGLAVGTEVRIRGDARLGAVVAFVPGGVRVRIAVENNAWTGAYLYRTFGLEQLEVLQEE